LELIRLSPGLDDDQLSARSGIRPRQQVNQICNRLAERGLITRDIGPNGKIVNQPAAPSTQSA
jgi:hypothetical protein